jgi:membrane protein
LAGVIGIAVLLFGASGVFTELQDALNTIWGVKPKEEGLKGLVKGRFTAFTMVLGICFLLLVSLVIGAVVAAVSERFSGTLPAGSVIGHVLELATSFAVITVLFAMIFKVLPDVKIGWNDVWTGAVVTALLFTLGKFVIGTYIGKAGIGSAYGAAGSIVIFITWVYYSAQILYFGAEFSQVYATSHGSRVVPADNAEPLSPEARAAQGLKSDEKARSLAVVRETPPARPAPPVAFSAAPPAPPRPLWNYLAITLAWLGTAVLMGRNAQPAGRNQNRAA